MHFLNQEEKEELKDFLAWSLGKKYKLGAEIPKGKEWDWDRTDCSELVETAFRILGYKVPDGSWMQYELSFVNTQPDTGHLVFLRNRKHTKIGHVAIFYDKRLIVHARGRPYNKIVIQSFDSFKKEFGKRVTEIRYLDLSKRI